MANAMGPVLCRSSLKKVLEPHNAHTPQPTALFPGPKRSEEPQGTRAGGHTAHGGRAHRGGREGTQAGHTARGAGGHTGRAHARREGTPGGQHTGCGIVRAGRRRLVRLPLC